MKQLFDTKLKKGIAIAAAVAMTAGIAAAIYIGAASRRENRSAEDITFAPYRQLYTLKATKLKDLEKVNSIIGLTTFYSENARIVNQEQATDGNKKGLVFELEETRAYPIQSKECRQQATVLLALIPKLDFVEYKMNGEVYRRYQQYGEESRGKVFVLADDKGFSANLKSGSDFAAFMDQVRPAYESQSVHEAAGKAILAELNGKFSGGEFGAEGHTIMSAETVNGKTRACAVLAFGSYRFINDNFVRIEGETITPAVLTFQVNDKGNYMFEHAEFAIEGMKYEDAVNEMFVKETAERTLANHERILQQLENDEKQQAQNYLKQLGRNSKIGKFSDFPATYLSKVGVSSEAANAILENDKLLSYPMWVGTQEFIEDGKRFVYETSYEEGNSSVAFKKYDYETKQTVEEFKVSVADGNFLG